jgi:hypothetical protein
MESTERKLLIRPAPAHFENHDLSVIRRRVMELPGIPIRACRRLRKQRVKIAHQIFAELFVFGEEATKSLLVVEVDVEPDEIVESSYGISIVLEGKG